MYTEHHCHKVVSNPKKFDVFLKLQCTPGCCLFSIKYLRRLSLISSITHGRNVISTVIALAYVKQKYRYHVATHILKTVGHGLQPKFLCDVIIQQYSTSTVALQFAIWSFINSGTGHVEWQNRLLCRVIKHFAMKSSITWALLIFVLMPHWRCFSIHRCRIFHVTWGNHN